MSWLREIKVPLFFGGILALLIWAGGQKDNRLGMTAFCGMGGIFAAFLLFLMVKQWVDSSVVVNNEIFDIGPTQEVIPERRRGAVIGYKWVDFDPDMLSIKSGGGYEWKHWQLEADAKPEMNNTNGIYVCFNPNDPELTPYDNGRRIKIEVELRGQKAIHPRGARGQFGRIARVVDVGWNTELHTHDGKKIKLREFYGGRK